ncbi:MAG: hypothetical protein ACLT76_05715 [Clostridium fessum]
MTRSSFRGFRRKKQIKIIKGDAKSVSIAAASIPRDEDSRDDGVR